MELSPAPPTTDPNRRIKLNVGGRLFETTASTLEPSPFLSSLSPPSSDDVIFIDRDPDLFSLLLSLLRSGHLRSSSASLQTLISESQYYGLDHLLRSATSPPPFLGVDASLSLTILPSSDPLPSSLSVGPTSLLIAHSGQISLFDPLSLRHVSSFRTHLNNITSLSQPDPLLSAVGSLLSPGLHFYHLPSGRHVASSHWSDPSDPRVYKARVTALTTTSSPHIFAAFECPHFENAVLSVDPTTLQTTSELGRQNASSSRTASPNKLAHLPKSGLVFASAVSSGSFGYAGYMRLWDPRVAGGTSVWETCEPGGAGRSTRFGDSFADADVDPEQMAIYKVCWNSGDVAVADMRMLGSGNDDPWFYLEDKGSGLRSAGRGQNSVLHCYKKQVFVSRQSGLEVCSSPAAEEEEEENAVGTRRTYVRNFVDTEEDVKRGMIRKMEGGGDRLFVIRDGMEGVEVWESSRSSGAVSLL